MCRKEEGMYIVVQHQIVDPEAAFTRGERLKRGDGAPGGARALQFYPSQDGAAVTCLWEGADVDDLQAYVDSTLGEASVNVCYAVDAGHAFAEQPPGIAPSPVTAGV
jgi:hypothetical protein